MIININSFYKAGPVKDPVGLVYPWTDRDESSSTRSIIF